MARALIGLAATLAFGPCEPPEVEPPAVVEAVPVEPAPGEEWADAATPTRAPEPEPVVAPILDTDASTAPAPTRPPIRPHTDVEFDRDLSGPERVRGAKQRKTAEVRALFAEADVAFPPGQLLFRVFKRERELEVWASSSTRGALTHVATYSVCAASGRPGPKTREGDWQVPEGFYAVDLFNPMSRYHLSMRVDYPNARDRSLRSTGGQIMIHGDCASVGCVAVGDERIEELWLMATALRKGRPHVHLFPGRDLEGFIAEAKDPELARFWEGLLAVERAFADGHEIPRVTWDRDGVYRPKN